MKEQRLCCSLCQAWKMLSLLQSKERRCSCITHSAELMGCVLQETPDSPEALNCIPSLQLSDIPKQAATIPTELSEARLLRSWVSTLLAPGLQAELVPQACSTGPLLVPSLATIAAWWHASN